jgi:hypothetical protein
VQRQLRQDLALERDRVRKDDVEGGQAVGRDQKKGLSEVVEIADLAPCGRVDVHLRVPLLALRRVSMWRCLTRSTKKESQRGSATRVSYLNPHPFHHD